MSRSAWRQIITEDDYVILGGQGESCRLKRNAALRALDSLLTRYNVGTTCGDKSRFNASR